MKPILVLLGLILSLPALAFKFEASWPDQNDIIIDDIFPVTDDWSSEVRSKMFEWNEIDSADASHPFRPNLNPNPSFGALDGNNTIGFLAEAELSAKYGLSYDGVLAWAVPYVITYEEGEKEIVECDIMLNPALSWELGPDDNRWFQNVILHELGHCRGLKHDNTRPSIMNVYASHYLVGDKLYRDDKWGIREQDNTTVSERDLVIYNKWHDGSSPQWMSMSPTTLRIGDTVNLNNIRVENRGDLPFDSDVSFAIYLSVNKTITDKDIFLNSGVYSSFSAHGFSTFDWSAEIPTSIEDCDDYYIGAIIDHENDWSERYENNNSVVFTNGLPYTGLRFTPTQLSLLLPEDSFEPNDSRPSAATITMPFSSNNLSIDEDAEDDFYRIDLSGPGTLTIDILFSHGSGNIDWQLQDSTGNALISSDSDTDNESKTLQIDAAGTYYLRVYGSGSGSCNQYQLNSSFNPDYPDLIVPNIEISQSNLSTGDSFNISATVSNQGVVSSSASTLRYYLSDDDSISAEDSEIASVPVTGLAMNENSVQEVNVSAPSIAGNYWVAACIDPVTDESDTTNNCSGARQITVEAPVEEQYPDLTLSSPDLSPSVIKINESFAAAITVINQGDASAAATTLRYYRSDDNVISGSDLEMKTLPVTTLAASASSLLNTTLSAPALAGDYWIGACIDSVAGESTTQNNCSSARQITVEPTRPDLTISSVEISNSDLNMDESFSVQATVSNNGDGDAEATTVHYYLSIDNTITSNDTEIGTTPLSALAADASVQATIDVATSPGEPGTFWIGVCVDEVPAESDTTNNCSDTQEIHVALPAQQSETIFSDKFENPAE